MSENTWGFLTMTMIGWRREDAANQARVWIKRYDIATSLSILLLVSICGCREPAPPDEPRAAGIAANREAAVDRFTPASYDYFKGMDSEAVLNSKTEEVSAVNDTGQAEKQSASPPNRTSLEPKASSQQTDNSSDRSNARTDKTEPAPRDYTLEEPKWSDNEIKGRNAWILWTAGNEAFWDWLARHGYGTIDLLKLVDSRQRSSRFARAGMINEPGTRACTEKEAKQTYGIYLDRLVDSTDDHYRQMMRPASPAYSDPSDNELENETSLPKKYSKQPASDVYGYSTGIVGLRPSRRSADQCLLTSWKLLSTAKSVRTRSHQRPIAYFRRRDSLNPIFTWVHPLILKSSGDTSKQTYCTIEFSLISFHHHMASLGEVSNSAFGSWCRRLSAICLQSTFLRSKHISRLGNSCSVSSAGSHSVVRMLGCSGTQSDRSLIRLGTPSLQLSKRLLPFKTCTGRSLQCLVIRLFRFLT